MTNTIKISNIAEPYHVDGRIDLERLALDADYHRCALGRILEGDYRPKGLEQMVFQIESMLSQIRTNEIQMTISVKEAMEKRVKLYEILKAAREALECERLDVSEINFVSDSEPDATVIPFHIPPLVKGLANAA